ncbi:hypothetical protein B0O99DRAFT_539214 [Bisporella sp. PMI_857]|nr:hypothetical protein B0O99DRAFT_539214 [Bisporella sp. PMI_857]
MADISQDVEVKVATTAADNFVKSYYPALNNAHGRPSNHNDLTSFYIKPNAASPLQADISLNGNIISDPAKLQSTFESEVGKCYYDVQSYDCHVLNANYNVGADESRLGPAKDGSKMSIIVMISGSVKYSKENAEGEVRGFTENIVLVPNWAAQGPKAPKGLRSWLIQSQSFRLVV